MPKATSQSKFSSRSSPTTGRSPNKPQVFLDSDPHPSDSFEDFTHIFDTISVNSEPLSPQISEFESLDFVYHGTGSRVRGKVPNFNVVLRSNVVFERFLKFVIFRCDFFYKMGEFCIV